MSFTTTATTNVTNDTQRRFHMRPGTRIPQDKTARLWSSAGHRELNFGNSETDIPLLRLRSPPHTPSSTPVRPATPNLGSASVKAEVSDDGAKERDTTVIRHLRAARFSSLPLGPEEDPATGPLGREAESQEAPSVSSKTEDATGQADPEQTEVDASTPILLQTAFTAVRDFLESPSKLPAHLREDLEQFAAPQWNDWCTEKFGDATQIQILAQMADEVTEGKTKHLDWTAMSSRVLKLQTRRHNLHIDFGLFSPPDEKEQLGNVESNPATTSTAGVSGSELQTETGI